MKDLKYLIADALESVLTPHGFTVADVADKIRLEAREQGLTAFDEWEISRPSSLVYQIRVMPSTYGPPRYFNVKVSEML